LESGGPLARLRRATQGGVAFGRPFAALVPRAPRVIAIGGTLLAIAGVITAVFYVRSDPMEYDLRNLRSDPSSRATEIRLSERADAITGYVGSDGMAILVDRPEQVPALKEALYRVRDAVPHDQRPFEGVHSLQDYVPEQQAVKIPLLLEIRDR